MLDWVATLGARWFDLDDLWVARRSEDPNDEYIWVIREGAKWYMGEVLGTLFADVVEAALPDEFAGTPVQWA